MTVIAALRPFGIPAIVGDLLVTARARIGNPVTSFLPTAPTAAAKLPFATGYRIAGGKKKVHLIGKRLAVAWAGSLLAGSKVIGKLYQSFSGRAVTRDELQLVLAEMTEFDEEPLNCMIVGWIVEDQPRQFRWNSLWPKEIFYDEADIMDGTGERRLSALLKLAVSARYFGSGIESNIERAIFFLLSKCSYLMHEELLHGSTLMEHFGYGYEIALFDGVEFRYVDSVTYLSWAIAVSPDGKQTRAILAPRMVKYHLLSQLLHLHPFARIVRRCDEVNEGIRSHPLCHVDGLNNRIETEAAQSAYYCNFLNFSSKPGQLVSGPLVTHESDWEVMKHENRNGLDWFEMNVAKLREMFSAAGALDPKA